MNEVCSRQFQFIVIAFNSVDVVCKRFHTNMSRVSCMVKVLAG
jgi:hypothetical protein